MEEVTGPARKPAKEIKIDQISGLVLVALALYICLHVVMVLPVGNHYRPGPGYFPLLLAAILGVCGIIVFFSGQSSPAFRSVDWPGAKKAFYIGLCCLFAVYAIEPLGYRLTILIILLFLFGVVERHKWWVTLALSLGLAFGTYSVFRGFLNVPLPEGMLGF
ncbi:MAG: tripartite tricarboxylate transporter TctB family protein [Deltaproteobacteria bacterium]|nr:tripartite tricarboxylate transporter TctB family protein [Deltaproteobacteria bacterium]